MSVLLISGGRGHPASATAAALAPILGDDVEVFDVEEGLAALSEMRHDLLVVNALAHTMRDTRYADADRVEWAFRLDADGQAATDAWIREGRPLLALHTALVSFDNWPRWHDIVGGTWEWGRSWHDAPQAFTVASTLGDIAPFEVIDECYEGLRFAKNLDVVATAGTTPIAWRHTVDYARVAACTLGHDAASFATPGHAELLRSLLAWLRHDEGTTDG